MTDNGKPTYEQSALYCLMRASEFTEDAVMYLGDQVRDATYEAARKAEKKCQAALKELMLRIAAREAK